jgi:hypothetical protein
MEEAIKLTPIEVKYRAMGMSLGEMREALTQAHNFGRLIEALWIGAPTTELWKTCGTALLAQLLDFGFRIYAADWLHGHQHAEWAALHQRVLQDVLESTARVTVNVAASSCSTDRRLRWLLIWMATTGKTRSSSRLTMAGRCSPGRLFPR